MQSGNTVLTKALNPFAGLGHAFALACLLLPLALAAKPIKFDIPAQAAADALIVFSKQAGVDVLYSFKDLSAVRSQPLTGEFEPEEGLKVLLKDTGFAAARDEAGKFVITREKPHTGSMVSAVVNAETGRPVEGARVRVVDTALAASTDHSGRFRLESVPPGSYSLVVTGEGFSPTRVTDVTVRADHEITFDLISLRPQKEGVTQLQEYVVRATTDVQSLDPYLVADEKLRPFATANVDIPRTTNDVQPYYIFDSKTLDQSGATSIEDFLKQRLTMNATGFTNVQYAGANPLAGVSSINLRGLGADKTLILVNGRRMAGVTVGVTTYQPALNGIPLSAIDRIEVLPSSASGIYGGSAIGGVVNIILKKNYAGGEIRATYDNTFNTDSPIRTVSASYGFALEGGKTHVMLSASWSDAKPFLLQDRRFIFDRNQATIARNDPTQDIFANTQSPFLGALPNIGNNDGDFDGNGNFVPYKLVLKPAYGGTTLNSSITHITAGTAPTVSASTLAAGLVANSGVWNKELPASTQAYTGLYQPFGSIPTAKSFQASVNRQLLPKLELFADFSYNENKTKSVYNPFSSTLGVSADSPVNPFTTGVVISAPDATQAPTNSDSVNRSFTVGAIAQLPWGWTGELDYSRSENRYDYVVSFTDQDAIDADLESGTINPFVDLLRYPINFGKYLIPQVYSGRSTLDDFALRGSGPLMSLPWGTPNLTVGLEHRIAKTPQNIVSFIYPISTGNSNITTYFARQSVTDSAYGEVTVPLVKNDWLPAVHALELQLSGRGERFKVDTGTASSKYTPSTGTTTYAAPTLNGQPYYAKTTYSSTNGTAGLKFQPVPELTLRTSIASAFLPPPPAQLVANPALDAGTRNVTDPVKSARYAVRTQSGGNPNLKPQTSKSFNAGVIWEPRWKPLQGLRFNAEYYRIEQSNAIGALALQTMVNLESTFPGRVTRDATTGRITQVNISSMNLYKRETEGWDLSADYTLKTGLGTFNLSAVESIIQHLKNQYSPTLPQSDAVNFPNEQGAVKYKGNATLTWERQNWTAGWSARYFGAYKQYGAVGGPDSTQSFAGAQDNVYITAQGSDTIPSQMYHDVFVSYAFGEKKSASGSPLSTLSNKLLSGVTVQLGVRNVFNKLPPFDYYYYNQNYYESPYGDLRLRTYWLTVKKTF
jgi:iron complex outermembrane receptor protein